MKKILFTMLIGVGIFGFNVIDVKADETLFPDENFEQCVVKMVKEKTGSEDLTDENLAKISTLDCNHSQIKDTKGIEKLTGLESLNLSGNQISIIDVSKNTELYYIKLDDNQLNKVDVSKNTKLQYLDLGYNQLNTVDVRKNMGLLFLYLKDNKLGMIDVSKNTELQGLNLIGNRLNEIDVSKNVELRDLYLSGNQLSQVDVSKNTELRDLFVDDNKLNNINLSKNLLLERLIFNNNKISCLDLSNNYLFIKNVLDPAPVPNSLQSRTAPNPWAYYEEDVKEAKQLMIEKEDELKEIVANWEKEDGVKVVLDSDGNACEVKKDNISIKEKKEVKEETVNNPKTGVTSPLLIGSILICIIGVIYIIIRKKNLFRQI